MPQSPAHPRNALSNAHSGESYTGLSCFPLGHHVAHTDISDLVSTLHRLRSCKILQPIPIVSLEDVKKRIEPLHVAQGFWSHHARDVQQLDIHTRTTYLYLCAKGTDLAGAVLHTLMSSRRCPRLQCFLAEYVLADQAERLSVEWELLERLQGDIDLPNREELELLERLENEGGLEAPVLFAKLRGYREDALEKTRKSVWWAEEEP